MTDLFQCGKNIWKKTNVTDMKIVLTETQHKRLVGTQPINESEIDQYQLKKVAFSIWDNMKKNGERPALLDIIYDLIGAQRNSYRDYFEVRPIWYEYNGGMGVLMEKLKEEILGKTFELKDPMMGLDTKFRIKELDMNLKHTWPSKFIELVCEVDKNGMIDYETYVDETDQVVQNRDTIEQALYELEYEQDDLENFLKGEIVQVLEPITDEKYGVPIGIDIEYVDFN